VFSRILAKELNVCLMGTVCTYFTRILAKVNNFGFLISEFGFHISDFRVLRNAMEKTNLYRPEHTDLTEN
jgi:hypothetical protein